MNMMPVTAGFLEPLAESIPLGIYASWSVHYLFGVDPYLWFAGHWATWLLLDYIQLRGIQVCLSARDVTLQAMSDPRGVDPYGTGGTRPPNIWTGGT